MCRTSATGHPPDKPRTTAGHAVDKRTRISLRWVRWDGILEVQGPRPQFTYLSSPALPMIYIYVMLQIALILLSIGGYFQVKRFLGQYSSVSDPVQLSAYKSLVR